MGLFDSITCELPLPSLPQGVLDRWKNKPENTSPSSQVIFQTKDTPNQGMSLYNIDSTGQLLIQQIEGYWEEPELVEKGIINDPDKLESYSSCMTALGTYKETSRNWEEVDFTGSINFYESYEHPDKPRYGSELYDDEDVRFGYVSGWVEYQAQFVKGKVQYDIILVSNELPIQRTAEEVVLQKESWVIQRAEIEKGWRTNRKKYPTPEQKLIDRIYNATVEAAKHELHEALVEDILSQIKAYREKIDIWYTDEN